ncbi:hypothetical protein C8R44DRAFT_885013 [Mycena epipterygia]|nr:hypothetical protein C8R44DRAFT_885013 [Mycena epipterygia]
MQSKPRLKKLIQYTTLAAKTTQDISDTILVPFLAVAGTMPLAILRSVDTSPLGLTRANVL